jgi:hypothetical protein
VVSITSDTFGSESSWTITDADGNSIADVQEVSNSTTYDETYTLDPGTYCVNLFDSWGDGGLAGSVTIDGEESISWAKNEYDSVGEKCFDVAGIEPPPLEPETCSDDEFEDCSENCVSNNYLNWQADGYCDDGSFGLNLNCAEFGFDGGDCN